MTDFGFSHLKTIRQGDTWEDMPEEATVKVIYDSKEYYYCIDPTYDKEEFEAWVKEHFTIDAFDYEPDLKLDDIPTLDIEVPELDIPEASLDTLTNRSYSIQWLEE